MYYVYSKERSLIFPLFKKTHHGYNSFLWIHCKHQLIYNIRHKYLWIFQIISHYLWLKSIWINLMTEIWDYFFSKKNHFFLLKSVGPHMLWFNGQKTSKIWHIFYPLDYFLVGPTQKKTKTHISFSPISPN